jgi:hypothetical protein
MARQVVQIHAIPAPPMIVPPSCSYQPAGTLTPDYKTPCCNNTFALTQPQFGGYQPGAGLPVVECVAAPAVKHVHLVTPDLEAHAARMTQRGDTIILEGDVILLNKKHAQPIRIEAQRAIINMKDGSVTVEGSGSISNFGVTRTSGVETVPVDNRQFQAICLRNSQAVDLAKVLNDAVPKSPFLRPKVDVLAEAISNSVLISGSPHWVEILARFVADLDRAAAPPIVLPTGFGR